jgi:L-alanine-DL-glutamate epimerase-like enolase superfamily enzyme
VAVAAAAEYKAAAKADSAVEVEVVPAATLEVVLAAVAQVVVAQEEVVAQAMAVKYQMYCSQHSQLKEYFLHQPVLLKELFLA